MTRRETTGVLSRRGTNVVTESGGGDPPNGGGGTEAFTLGTGGDLPAEVAAADPGDVIILEAGGTYDLDSQLSIGKNLTIRAQEGAGVRAVIRSGNGDGNYVIVKSKDGRWRWLPLEGTDISSSGGNPGNVSYVGPHVNPNGTIDLSNISSTKAAGEDFNDWPAGAASGDYETLRGDGGNGINITSGTVTLRNLQFECFEIPLRATGGDLVVQNSVALGCRTCVDMNAGSDVTLEDSFFSGGSQNSWTWVEVKSGELDPVGKRTFVSVRDATGTLTIQRCTAHDFFDGVVGNPSEVTMIMDQVTLEGRPDDLEQVQAGTRGDMTVTRTKVFGTSFGGSTSTTGPNSVTRVFEDCVVRNWRELYDYNNPRWRRLTNNHQQPFDPVTVRRCTFIEFGGTNNNGVVLNSVYGATWGGNSTRKQQWIDVALVMATSSGKIGRDFDNVSGSGLNISGSAILNIDGGTLTFDNGGDFTSWKAASDAAAELITDTGFTGDQLWNDPRLISQRFGRTVGAVPAAAAAAFRDKDGDVIGDPNDWSDIETPTDVEGGGGGGGEAFADGTFFTDGFGWV